MARLLTLLALTIALLPGHGEAASRCGGGQLVVLHSYGSPAWMELVPRHGTPRALDTDSFTALGYSGADRASWSPDGRYVAYGWNETVGPAVVAGHLRVTRVSDGRRTDDLTIPVAGLVVDVAWSPDSKRFAFTLFTVNSPVFAATWSLLGSHSAVWLYDPAATPALRPITTLHTEYDYSPAWNRDGHRLAWLSDFGGITRPVVQDVDAAPPGLPTSLGSGLDPATTVSWSPNGRLLAWTTLPLVSLSYVPATLWVARPDGSSARKLARVAPDRPTWSPDSSRLAYSTLADGYWAALRTIDVRSGRSRTLPAAVGNRPAWSPDGRELAYVRSVERAHGEALSVVSADGRRSTDLVGPQDYNGFGDPVWCR